jgi:hypothetical protein
MDATIPCTTDDELDLDVIFVEPSLEVAGVSSEDCTSDGCDDSHDENCYRRA